MPTDRHAPDAAHVHYFARIPTRWERVKGRFTWGYIRQTRLLYPITVWWLNRG